MRFRFNAALCVGFVLVLSFPVSLRAQGDTRITDSLLFSLRTDQTIRVRLAGGARRSAALVRVDTGTSRLTLKDGKPSIDPEAIDLLYVRAGGHGGAGAAIGGVSLGLAFGGLLAAAACVDGCVSGTEGKAALAGGAVGVVVGALIGGAVGAFIPNWRLQFSRPIRRTASLRTGRDFTLAYAINR